MSTIVDACVPIDPEQFHRVLAIELGTSIEYSPMAARQPDGASVHVVCIPSGGVQLQLADSLTRKSMQRVVELPDADVATRTRLLALSVAEFVVASWVELQLAEPPIAPAGPPAPKEATQPASELASARLPKAPAQHGPSPEPSPEAGRSHGAGSAMRWLVGVSVEPVLFLLNGGLVPQLSLHVEERPTAHLALGLAFSVGRAQWAVTGPSVPSGTMARISSSSARLSLRYVFPFAHLELSGGLGVRGGIAYMAGDAKTRDLLAVNLYAPWGGPALLLSAAGTFGALRLALELEAGYVTLPAQALLRDRSQPPSEGVVVAELSGVWASAGLYVGWMF